MGSAARTVNLPLHGGETYTPLCKLAQHFFSHSAAFTKFISKCRLFPYVSPNRARFLSRLRTAIPPWRPTVGRLFCWESPYCLPAIRALVALLPAVNTGSGRPIACGNTGSWSPYLAFAQYGLLFFASLRICVVSVATRAAGTYLSTPPCPWASFLASASSWLKND